MLTVGTYNLYLGADLSLVFGVRDEQDLRAAAAEILRQLTVTDFALRAAAVASLLVRERVDVVGLQEVATWSRVPDGGAPQVWCAFLPLLVAALAEAGTAYDVHAVNATFGGGGPVVDGQALAIQGAEAVLVRRDADLRVLGERTGDFGRRHEAVTGLPGLSFAVDRGWGEVELEYAGTRLRFVNTHTEAWQPAVRDAQRDELLAVLGRTGDPVVLVGDLNAAPDEVGIGAPYRDAWLAAGHDPGAGATSIQAPDLGNPPGALDKRIDYVWVRDLAVGGCRVIGDLPEDRTPAGLWPSDHAGVVAEVAPL